MFNRRVFKFVAVVAALMILSTIAYAFAASITVPASNAGSGAAAVGGYTVDAIDYTLAADPTNLSSVQLTLNTDADGVQARITGTGAWVGCTETSAMVWDCPVGGTVFAADNLQVVAYTNAP